MQGKTSFTEKLARRVGPPKVSTAPSVPYFRLFIWIILGPRAPRGHTCYYTQCVKNLAIIYTYMQPIPRPSASTGQLQYRCKHCKQLLVSMACSRVTDDGCAQVTWSCAGLGQFLEKIVYTNFLLQWVCSYQTLLNFFIPKSCRDDTTGNDSDLITD